MDVDNLVKSVSVASASHISKYFDKKLYSLSTLIILLVKNLFKKNLFHINNECRKAGLEGGD